MNLRLDSNSIRIRVSLEEAKFLFHDGKIETTLPLPTGDLFLELIQDVQEKLSLGSSHNQRINLGVPSSVLKGLLLEIASVSPSSKQALGVCETIYFDAKPIELRFEIDCFTTRQKTKKENNHD